MTAPTASGGADEDWPGQRLGLPRTGPGSVAGWGRRVLAIFIDWMLCLLVVSVLTSRAFWLPPLGVDRWLPLIVFVFEVTILTVLLGGSAGQLITRIAVRRLHGNALDPLRAFLRAFLIILVIPPVIYNRDQRGLHDLATDSIVVRR